MKRSVATTVLCATAALGLTACSDDRSPKAEAAHAASALCTNLSTLKGDTAKLDALDPATATKDQIKDAYEAVQKDWTAVGGDLGDLKGAKKDALNETAVAASTSVAC